MAQENGGQKVSADLNANVGQIKSMFKDDESLIARYFENQSDPSIECCAFYVDGMVDNRLFNDDIIKPIQEYRLGRGEQEGFIDVISKRITSSNSVEKSSDFFDIIQAVVYGDCALFVSGCSEALILNSKGFVVRSVSEPESEKILRGPREGFNESLMMNLSMLRRKLRTQELKMKFKTFGSRTQTRGCVCYIEGIVNQKVLAELETRLGKISIDGALDSNYIAEFICDDPYSPVETVSSTERPDVVASKLLEGRIAFFLDGTPMVLTVPKLLIEHFQSNEDYYVSYYFASIDRLLRIAAFFISISTPGVFVALTTYHPEMLPTPLLMSIAAARQGVPLPTVVEAVLMLVVFEILRETGVRMPSSIGQALSIVGALVIGQAAVAARLVSAPMIVVVAFTGITGLLLPRLKGSIIIFRFILLMLSSLFGLYGYILGMIGLLTYLLNMRSFGVPILGGGYGGFVQKNKDVYLRLPWWMMVYRPKYFADDKQRTASGGKPQ